MSITASEATKVSRSWLVGAPLDRFSVEFLGNLVKLEFDLGGSPKKLAIFENWEVRDSGKDSILQTLAEKLDDKLDKRAYLRECISHSADILRLYLSFSFAVTEAKALEDGGLKIDLENGISITVNGRFESESDSTEELWSLEIPSETENPSLLNNFRYRVVSYNSDSGLAGIWDASEINTKD
jgi:hypothetical protein